MSANKVSWDFLPGEIVTQILLRLPIKSIITSYLRLQNMEIHNPKPHLHFHPSPPLHHHQPPPPLQHLLRFDFLVDSFTINPRFRVVATCNGLVCFSDDLLGYTNQFYLWNPCVRKYVKLPYPNCYFRNRDEFIHSIGFGFDPKTNDYKVVRMVSLWDDPDCGKDRPKVEVYTLSTGEWRMVTPVLSPICILHDCPTPAFVNGALHWIGFRRNGDQFRLFCFGVSIWVMRSSARYLCRNFNFWWIITLKKIDIELSAVYGNSIALFHSSYFRGFLDIWVMKEYGVASSWTKVLTFTEHNPGVDLPLALGFRRNSQLVLQVQNLKLISLDLGKQNGKDLGYQNGKDLGINTYLSILLLVLMLRVWFCLTKPPTVQLQTEENRSNAFILGIHHKLRFDMAMFYTLLLLIDYLN
uniref:F-box associated beta-propeller type 1 domain-containing protein n=1 Tax=Fagus sylvatica TaxID=28930 RepID=A0A2N9H4Y8_FAGSY